MQRIVLLLFCFCLTQLGNGQDAFSVSQIKFEGLKKTKKDFVKLFILSTENQAISDSLIQADVQRIKNISGIGNAEYRLDTLETGLSLTFKIHEIKTFLPIINFGGIRDNFWFKLGVSDINWKGKGQFVSAYYQNTDRRHSGQIYYRNPYWKGSTWGTSASINRWASREPLFFPEATVLYDYEFNSIQFSVIKRFGFNRNVELGGNFFIENYTKIPDPEMANLPGPDGLTEPKFLIKSEYSENFLNYHLFYLSGLSWRLTLQNVYNIRDQSWFNSLQLQGRRFYRISKKGNLAFRLRLALSTNNDTPFAPYVADSHVNIRGIGNRIDRGTAQAILNAEYRHTVYQSGWWGVQVVGFTDIGTWRNPGGVLLDLFDPNQLRQFVGGGFRVIYQKVYGVVIRVDYGVDLFDKNQRGFVIGLGQYF